MIFGVDPSRITSIILRGGAEIGFGGGSGITLDYEQGWWSENIGTTKSAGLISEIVAIKYI